MSKRVVIGLPSRYEKAMARIRHLERRLDRVDMAAEAARDAVKETLAKMHGTHDNAAQAAHDAVLRIMNDSD